MTVFAYAPEVAELQRERAAYLRLLQGSNLDVVFGSSQGSFVPAQAKFNPSQPRDDEGQWTDGIPGPAVGAFDKLKGAGRIDLEPGERLVTSDRMRGDNGRAWLAVTEKDGKRSLRIGLGNAVFGTRHDHGGLWKAGPDRSAEIDQERAERRELINELENEIEDLEGDPDADPVYLAGLRGQLDGYEDADSDVAELPGGYTAMLDENGARRLRETLAKALGDGEKLQAELDEPYAEFDRLTLERDKLKRKAMGRKFTDEEDAEWDRLTAEIARAQAEIDPDSGPERPESGYWTLAEGSIPGQWADVHYDIYLDDPDVGVEVKLGAVPYGSDMDFDDLRGNEMAASFHKDEGDQLVKLLAKVLRGTGGKTPHALALAYWPLENAAEVKTGAMIALLPSEADTARLAVPGGEPAGQLHCTLVYLGEAADIPQPAQDALVQAMQTRVEHWSANIDFFPVEADGFALSVFNPPGHTSAADGKQRQACITLGLSGDQLDVIQGLVRSSIADVQGAVGGFEVPEQHVPWSPHLTLIYTDDVEQLAELVNRTGPVTFDRIRIAFAGKYCDIPLRSSGLQSLPGMAVMGLIPFFQRSQVSRWRLNALLSKFNPLEPRDAHGQWTDGMPGSGAVSSALDKLKLGKRAPAGFSVRSSKKLRTDYADVGIAEVDGPDGPHIRIGVIGNESGKWDAGFTGESRKAKLREEIARKQALMDSDSDDVDDDIEDQIIELSRELEDLDNERTAILSPEALADLRRQLDDGLTLAKANKVKQDATVKALDSIDEKRNAIIDEFSDPDLERKISNASGRMRSHQKSIRSLENGPNPPHWSPELIAELIESHKASVAKYEAELAPMLARRAELMPPDARARLEDLDRQYQALNDDDIDDIITSAEVSTHSGTKVRAEIWGSDDEDEQWVSTRLYVLAPGETTDDADQSDGYGSFRGLKGLSKLIAGFEAPGPPAAPGGIQARFDPHQPRDGKGKWTDGPGIDLPDSALKGFKVHSQDEYAEEFGDPVDEQSVDLDLGDGTSLTVRYFDSSAAHIVVDHPDGTHQVIEDMTPDAMRTLAYNIEEVLGEDIDEDEDYLGGIVADTDSSEHGIYVALYDTGDVKFQPTDDNGEQGDYLDLSEDEARELVEALRDMADSHEDHDFDAQDDPGDEDAEAEEGPEPEKMDAAIGEIEVSYDSGDNTLMVDWPGSGFSLPADVVHEMADALRRLARSAPDDDPDTRVERVELSDGWVVDLYGDGRFEIGPVDGSRDLDETDLHLEDAIEANEFAGTLEIFVTHLASAAGGAR